MNAVTAKVLNPTAEIKATLTEALKYRVTDAEHTDAYKYQGWDGFSSFFNNKTDTFPAGFVHLVVHKLKPIVHNITVKRKSLPEPLGTLKEEIDGFKPYPYQTEVVNELLDKGMMKVCNLLLFNKWAEEEEANLTMGYLGYK